MCEHQTHHTEAAALQALNVIKRDYFQHADSFVLYTVFMRLCTYVYSEYFPRLKRERLTNRCFR